MPRVNPLRTVANERNLAARIGHEREQRGWTLEGTAKRMAEVGYPIQPTAIYKIEKGDPPRRITVDELVGFATVFGTTVDNLLLPLELVHDQEARRLFEESTRAADDLLRAINECIRLDVMLYRHDGTPTMRKLLDLADEQASLPFLTELGGHQLASPGGTALLKAFSAIRRAIGKRAKEIAAESAGA